MRYLCPKKLKAYINGIDTADIEENMDYINKIMRE